MSKSMFIWVRYYVCVSVKLKHLPYVYVCVNLFIPLCVCMCATSAMQTGVYHYNFLWQDSATERPVTGQQDGEAGDMWWAETVQTRCMSLIEGAEPACLGLYLSVKYNCRPWAHYYKYLKPYLKKHWIRCSHFATLDIYKGKYPPMQV